MLTIILNHSGHIEIYIKKKKNIRKEKGNFNAGIENLELKIISTVCECVLLDHQTTPPRVTCFIFYCSLIYFPPSLYKEIAIKKEGSPTIQSRESLYIR
jgi:hypothetical protein